MHRNFTLAAALLMTLSLMSAPASAGDNPLIAQGVQEYNDLMYEESVNTLSAALMRAGNTDAQLIEIYKYLGLNYMLLDKPAEAAGAFRQLMCIDESWGFDPVATSPKITTFFDSTKMKWIQEGKPGKAKPAAAPVEFLHKVPSEGIKAEQINLQFTVNDPDMLVAKVALFIRKGKSFTEYGVTPMAQPSTQTVYMSTIPAGMVMPPHVDYFLQAVDSSGTILSALGAADTPLRVSVPGEAKVSVAKKWWFWTIIGVAVAGIAGGIAGGVIASKKNGSSDPASFIINICETGDTSCP